MDNSLENPFFVPFFASVQMGAVFHLLFHFSPSPAFGCFPCHTSPVWCQFKRLSHLKSSALTHSAPAFWMTRYIKSYGALHHLWYAGDDQREGRVPRSCQNLLQKGHVTCRGCLIDNGQTNKPKDCGGIVGRREKTPTPKTRFSIWTLLRTPGRFTTRPLPVHFATKMSVVRPFSVLSKDEIGP